MDFTCTKYYHFLKSRDDILEQIAVQEKYDAKKPKPNLGAMIWKILNSLFHRY